MATRKKKIIKEKSLRKRFVEKLAILVTTAFGLVAALAWNDAIRGLFAEEGYLYFLAKYGPWVYAIFVTILAVIITYYISRFAEEQK
jgi:hypothetical protein